MSIAKAVLRLVRPSTSVLVVLSILIPLLVRTRDLTISVTRAVPLLFVCMCTFISNDLSDIEKDKINHPDRPLPSGYLAPSFVAVLYFACLALALFTTRRFVQTPISFLYYLLLSLCISYNYIVEYLPAFKATYVAIASSMPILILAAYYPNEKALYPIALALFAFMLGRELCKDIIDRAGDPESILQRIPANRMAMFAFSSQAVGLAILTLRIGDLYHLLDLICMAALFGLSYRLWFRLERRSVALALMKLSLSLVCIFYYEPSMGCSWRRDRTVEW